MFGIKTKMLRGLNSLGNNKCCYVCKKTFFAFGKLKMYISPMSENISGIGSCVDNHSCPLCFCNDRERHLFAYFDKLNLWTKEGGKILHFAPEKHLSKKISSCNPLEYIKADFMPENYINMGIKDVIKVNLMEIPFADNHFDIVICNHVLEHIPDMQKGLAEIHRVLKNGGFAILQTPLSQLLHNHFEDSGITTDEQRTFFYGQNDHVRIVSERQFLEDLKNQGFKLAIARHEDLFDSKFAEYYGVNPKEYLIRVVKI
jgi:SAM-dependent methyltransferase